jgi:hypothetical protein
MATSTLPTVLRVHPGAALPWAIAFVLLAVAAAYLWATSRTTWPRDREIWLKIASVFTGVCAAATAVTALYAFSHAAPAFVIVVALLLISRYMTS